MILTHFMEQETNRFELGAKVIIYALALLLPLWIFPWSSRIEFGRESIFGSLIILATILWFLSILTRGRLRYQYSAILWTAAALVVVAIASTVSSTTPLISALLAEPAAERLTTLIFGFLLMALTGSILRTRKEIGTLFSVIIFAGAFTAILNLINWFFHISLYKYLASFTDGTTFNVIGTINGLALFYVVLFLMGLEILLSSSFRGRRPFVRIAFIAADVIFLANLLIINFRTSWIVLIGGGIFLFGLMFKNAAVSSAETGTATNTSIAHRLGWRYWIALGILVLAVVMLMVRSITVYQLDLPAEVTPSFSATYAIARPVLTESPKNFILGSGPATFTLDWDQYRNPAVNQTLFWNITFNQGHSWFATIIPTMGFLGMLAFLTFLGTVLFLILKQILTTQLDGDTVVPLSAFLGFIGLLMIAFLYPANTTFILFIFFIIGALSLTARHGDETPDDGPKSVLTLSERTIVLEEQWRVFLSSLLLIFLIAFAAAGLYFEYSRIRSAVAQQQGVVALANGNLERAASNLEQSVVLVDYDFHTYQNLLQVRMEKLRSLIQRASQGNNVQNEFQSTLTLAIQNAQRTIDLYPQNSAVWQAQGALYELLIPFIPGSENSAYTSYRKAADLDPQDPSIHTEWARAILAFADRVNFTKNQAGADPHQLDAVRTKAFADAREQIQKALDLKPDLATAYFLNAQIGLREGNVQSAIENAERAKQAAPFDTGVAFQLGLLYYQNSNLAHAEQEFARAVSLDENFANARYFLGLVYDRRREEDKAIEQFRRVQQLNPGNEDVAKILKNLEAGKSALEGVAPPATQRP